MFTKQEILDEFEAAQWLGRKSHRLRVETWESSKWWKVAGRTISGFPLLSELLFESKVVPTRAEGKAMRITITSHGVRREACPSCQSPVERRQGTNRVFHFGGRKCSRTHAYSGVQ